MEDKNNIEEKVMSEIKSGRVRLYSKYLVLTEKMGIGSVFVLSVLLAFLFFSLVLFYLKSSDNLGYLAFGNSGLLAFLESFPYFLVVSLIFVIFIAGIILKRTEVAYKKPFGYIAVGLIVLVIIVGVVLDIFGFGDRVEKEVFERPHFSFFQPFFENGRGEHPGGIAGRILEIGDEYILIQTPRSLLKLDLSKMEKTSEAPLQKGQFIMAIGERKGDVFEVRNLKFKDERGIIMIQRGVHRRFGEFNDISQPRPIFLGPPVGNPPQF